MTFEICELAASLAESNWKIIAIRQPQLKIRKINLNIFSVESPAVRQIYVWCFR